MYKYTALKCDKHLVVEAHKNSIALNLMEGADWKGGGAVLAQPNACAVQVNRF